jgi:hypothetical protein
MGYTYRLSEYPICRRLLDNRPLTPNKMLPQKKEYGISPSSWPTAKTYGEYILLDDSETRTVS